MKEKANESRGDEGREAEKKDESRGGEERMQETRTHVKASSWKPSSGSVRPCCRDSEPHDPNTQKALGQLLVYLSHTHTHTHTHICLHV